MIRLFIFIIYIVLFKTTLSAATISSSILPIQSFVSMVTEGTISDPKNYPKLILDRNVSPHEASLTFKQVQYIKDSKIIFITSRSLETSFIKHINVSKTKLIVIDELPGLNLYKFNNKSFTHDGEHEHAKDDTNHSHGSSVNDYHVWLDPIRAITILKAIAKELGEIYPDNVKNYEKNVEKYSEQLISLDKSIKNTLKGFNKNVMFFHNGWQYYIKAYNIKYYGTVINYNGSGHSHGLNMSAKSYITLNNYIKNNNIKCIFSEPEFDDRPIKELNKNSNFKISLLQPLESYDFKKLKTEQDYIEIYFTLMQYNSKTLANCY